MAAMNSWSLFRPKMFKALAQLTLSLSWLVRGHSLARFALDQHGAQAIRAWFFGRMSLTNPMQEQLDSKHGHLLDSDIHGSDRRLPEAEPLRIIEGDDRNLVGHANLVRCQSSHRSHQDTVTRGEDGRRPWRKLEQFLCSLDAKLFGENADPHQFRIDL
jgi:hypothetical protein